MEARAHIYVSGRVQGVCYRDFTQRWASSLQLTGWVKNLYDGRVEAVVEGEKEKIETLVNKLKEGPSLASVENADLTWEVFTGEYTDFRITW
ncbi:MAG: acylphosphatase [Candidatus Aminicenantes bacterium]|nr:acylphosphatase [Candidatus Aminicenantes bacterium]